MFFYSISTGSYFTPLVFKVCLNSDVRYVNYLPILAYNSRMVDFHNKVFSQKLFRIKCQFELYIIWPKFAFWPYGPWTHSVACPCMGIGDRKKLLSDIFRILPVQLVSMQNFSLVSQFASLPLNHYPSHSTRNFIKFLWVVRYGEICQNQV